MRIAIVGYGRMGHEVEAVAAARGHDITARIDPAAPDAADQQATPDTLNGADVAIEFSLADAIEKNASAYAGAGISAVVGTTGWDDRKDTIAAIVNRAGIAYVHGSNFSIGAHIFFALTQYVSGILNEAPEYDIFLREIHHAMKQDSPSGTALTAADRVIRTLARKNRVMTETAHRKIESDELHVTSSRGGSVPGVHSVYVDSAADTIEIHHTARSRAGFALGAVRAAEWIRDRRGFIGVDDFIRDILRLQ